MKATAGIQASKGNPATSGCSPVDLLLPLAQLQLQRVILKGQILLAVISTVVQVGRDLHGTINARDRQCKHSYIWVMLVTPMAPN